MIFPIQNAVNLSKSKVYLVCRFDGFSQKPEREYLCTERASEVYPDCISDSDQLVEECRGLIEQVHLESIEKWNKKQY